MAIKVNTRSPYFLKYEDSNLTSVEIEIYIYDGELVVDKGSVDYELTNDVISGNDFVIFEVSELVRDFFEHSFSGNYGSNTLWMTVDATLKNVDATIRTESQSYLIVDGYTTYKDGVNSQGSRSKLISASSVTIPENEVVRIPVFGEDVISVTSYTPQTQNLAIQSRWDAENRLWNINEDYWDNQATAAVSTLAENATLSDGQIQYATIPHSVNLVKISTASGDEFINVFTHCPTKYGSRKVTFINRHGALQDVWFNGARRDITEVTDNTYKASPIDFNSMSYNAYKGQVKRYGVDSTRSIRLNSGWVHESENETFEEILMSEHAWITEDNVQYPIIPKATSLERKTSAVDGLINYEIEFDYAFDNNNTVI
jgi:hypothetical protein